MPCKLQGIRIGKGREFSLQEMKRMPLVLLGTWSCVCPVCVSGLPRGSDHLISRLTWFWSIISFSLAAGMELSRFSS